MSQNYSSLSPDIDNNWRADVEQMNANFAALRSNFSGTTSPPTPITGQPWYKTDTEELYIWDGAAWVLLPEGYYTFLELEDTPISYSGFGGYFLRVNDAGTHIIFHPGLTKRFKDLTDTPETYDGDAGRLHAVNAAESAIVTVHRDGTNLEYLGEFDANIIDYATQGLPAAEYETVAPGFSLNNLASSLIATTMGAYNGRIILWGGMWYYHPDVFSLRGLDTVGTGEVHAYDTATNTWSKIYTDATYYANHGAINQNTGIGYFRSHNNRTLFDFNNDTVIWQESAPSSVTNGVRGASGVWVDDENFVGWGGIYGTNVNSFEDFAYSTVYEFNTVTKAFRTLANHPNNGRNGIYYDAACAIGMTAYSFGGRYPTLGYSGEEAWAFKFNYSPTGTGSWTPIRSLPKVLAYHTATPISETQILIFGGVPTNSTIYLYDTVADNYQEFGTFATGRHNANYYDEASGLLYAQIGVDTNGAAGRIYQYDIGGKNKLSVDDIKVGEGLMIVSDESTDGSYITTESGKRFDGVMPFAVEPGSHYISLAQQAKLYKIKRYE